MAKAGSRMEEVEDEPEVLAKKCQRLANFLKSANNCMVYTGAGISTAASIPDYRGPQGVWTLAGKGEAPAASVDPLLAEPTLSHMALRELVKRGYVRHLLSQNCDGLHLRSGLPQTSLSEVHGNMYVEVCTKCAPLRQYIRDFDVTGTTGFRRHGTERRCDACRAPLRDTIVHFGEWGRLAWPLNWTGATDLLAQGCDLILCIGSSLQILNRYPFLCASDKPAKQRPKLVIVNLQWTPKDRASSLKINGRCDEVLQRVMGLLGLPVPDYCRSCDPVLGRKRRSGRNKDLLDKMSECSCASRPPSARSSPAPLPSVPSASQPGWWSAGLSSLQGPKGAKKRPSQDPKAPKRKRGRPPKVKATPQPSDDEEDDLPLAALRPSVSDSPSTSAADSPSTSALPSPAAAPPEPQADEGFREFDLTLDEPPSVKQEEEGAFCEASPPKPEVEEAPKPAEDAAPKQEAGPKALPLSPNQQPNDHQPTAQLHQPKDEPDLDKSPTTASLIPVQIIQSS